MVVALPVLFLLAGLLGLSALCSATEAAVLSVNKVRLRHLMEQGHRGARLTFDLLTHLDRVIGTLLIVNNLANVAISAVASWVFVTMFGFEQGLAVATVVVAATLLLIGEMTPKIIGVDVARYGDDSSVIAQRQGLQMFPFKKYRINLTKIESRPCRRKAWEYYFFVDMEGHYKDKKVSKAIAELEKECVYLKILGSYPAV